MAESLAGQLALGGLLLCWLLAHLHRLAAAALGILDRPGPRSAREHQSATPTGAGVCFAAIILSGSFLLPGGGGFSAALALPLLLALLTGLVDDWRGLAWPVRIAAHCLAAAWLLALAGLPAPPDLPFLAALPVALAAPLWLLALVWLLNLYNFMDGIDGLAAAQAAFALAAALLLAWLGGSAAPPWLALALGALLGFLIVNWPKARVFMGDAGSGFLGLLFGCLLATGAAPGMAAWLILLGWFLTDASLTLACRFLRGQAVHQAHSLHAYQHLNRRFGTAPTLALLLAVKCLWLLPLAWLAAQAPESAWILLGLALTPLLALQALAGAGQAQPLWRWLRVHD